MKQFNYTVTDQLGIHARPAGLLVKLAGSFQSSVKLNCGGKEADGKRILGVMSLAVKKDQTVTFTVDGPDEEKAAAELEAFMKANL